MNDDRINDIAADVAYIRGQVDTLASTCKDEVAALNERTTSLEESFRNQNIFVVVYGLIIGAVAWLKGS